LDYFYWKTLKDALKIVKWNLFQGLNYAGWQNYIAKAISDIFPNGKFTKLSPNSA
jgi:hypothetical protein